MDSDREAALRARVSELEAEVAGLRDEGFRTAENVKQWVAGGWLGGWVQGVIAARLGIRAWLRDLCPAGPHRALSEALVDGAAPPLPCRPDDGHCGHELTLGRCCAACGVQTELEVSSG